MFTFFSRLSPLRKVLLGYLIISLLGWGLLSLAVTPGESVAAIDHLFVAVSALTTTGLTTIDVADSYTWWGESVTLLLLQVGGIGFMSFTAIVLLPRPDPKSGKSENDGMIAKDYAIPEDVSPRLFIRNVIQFTVVAEIIGALVLSVCFYRVGETEPVWNGIYTAVSAFCTAGFSLFSDSLVGYREHWVVNVAIMLLSLFGAFGFLFYTDVLERIRGKKPGLSLTSSLISVAMITGIAACFTGFYFDASHLSLGDGTRWLAALFQAVSVVSTTGFHSVPTDGMETGLAGLVILLMFIGASPSGTGGGIKNTTFLIALAFLRAVILEKPREQVALLGKQLPQKRIRTALSVFLTSVLFLALVSAILLRLAPVEPLTLLFEATSALGTVGLSFGVTGDLPFVVKGLLIVLMYCGRVGVLSVLIALTRGRNRFGRRPRGEEEDVAVES